MTIRQSSLSPLIAALRRRRMLSTAGLYVVGAWLVMQAADVFFPGWGIPDAAINVLLVAAILGFPVALVFGWIFNITTTGIMRTMPVGPDDIGEPRPLKRSDYLVLGALVLVAGGIVSYAVINVLALQESRTASLEKRPNSLAVLPFENISTDQENEIFSDGVSEEIRNRLGEYSELRVIARTSSFQFKNSELGIPAISDLLGVRYLLRGSVRRHGDRIRISAQLVEDTGTQLWSRSFDRILADVFAIQDEIANLVATEVAPQIVAIHEGGYTPSLEAYEHFLAGRELVHRRDMPAARKELAVAIELDPDYAEARAEYAISLLIGAPEKQVFQEAKAAIDAALALVPDLPRALAARGLYFIQQFPPEPVAAEAVLREAVRRAPNMVDAINWLSGALGLQGRDEEADQWLEKGYVLDPFNAAIAMNTARRYWEAGNLDRAEAVMRRLVELPEPPALAIYELIEFYHATGRLLDAGRIARRSTATGAWRDFFLARNFAFLGLIRSAAQWNAANIRANPEEVWIRTGWAQAQVPYWEGDYGRAADEMREAWMANGTSLADLPFIFRAFYGITQALGGEHAGAIDTLAEDLPSEGDPHILDDFYGMDAYQALAWAYLKSGQPEKAGQLLETVERWFTEHAESIHTVKSTTLYEAARNAAMISDHELALDRLEQAVTAGWREVYVNTRDPRWETLRDDARYQALMARVKADVDRQRAEAERIAAEEGVPETPHEVSSETE
jgi:TolB-like protein/Tfp pilus assembly protein PilF